jgi:hypothetical protein
MSLSRGRIFGIYVHSDYRELHLGKSGDVRLAKAGRKGSDKFGQFGGSFFISSDTLCEDSDTGG